MALTIILVTIFILITDLAFQKSLFRLFSLNNKKKLKRNGQYIFWGISFSIILYFIIFIIIEKKSSQPDYIVYRNYFNLSGLFVLIYIPKVIFILFVFIELIIRLIANLTHKIKPIPFLAKLSTIKVMSGLGVLVMLIVFGIILNGIINGKTNYQTEYVSVSFKNLPKNFNNLKIAQISDMHLGSFKDPKDVRKGIDQLMKEKPDIIFLTGDLVNNLSIEAKIMLPELKRLKAPLGVYSILGNHDVGDYRRWNTIEEKTEDFNQLIKIQKEAGFILLKNEHQFIKRDNDSIAILGIESWGKPPFKQYGILDSAIKGLTPSIFKILLSHNPSHWDVEIAGKNNIDLTLAGHTHAMQIGINCGRIFWSPIKKMYPHWAGLYHEGAQYLYVNRGFGFLGFPGRIGMTPEITIIQLKTE